MRTFLPLALASCHIPEITSPLADCLKPLLALFRSDVSRSLAPYAAAIGARYFSPVFINAQTILAILFASATRTNIDGLRDSIPASHVLGCADRWTCRLMMTLLAPMISNRRNDLSPIFVVARSRCLSPVECCRGVSPNQAAKSCPRRKISGGGARVARAVAIGGPISSIVMRRLAVSS